ncbi:sulfatase [Daejeonella sp.]|uniref:sulfatase family protein n=1 Tax=Daejeonella sp. TaxID=2805397 RepID=UPI0030C44CEF
MKYTLLLLAILFSFQSFSQSKPNLVIFITDDQNQQDVGAYGNPDVHTPNMDQLAKEGMRFNKAYAASSMCAPSRSVMFTGLYPYRNGSQMNHFTTRPGISNLPAFLKEAGYRVVISGKTDVFPLAAFPFEHIGKEFGKYEPMENRTDRRQESVKMIESHFKTNPEQPLCIIIAPWLPHVPWVKNRDYDAAKLKLPEYLADTKETRAAVASYYQSISTADSLLGEIMTTVDRVGKKNNTAFFYFSDQGAQFPGAKWTVYDKGLRVPFIVRWPGKVVKGSTSDALVSLVDLTPTLVDMAGLKPREGLDGKSFKEVLTGVKKVHHDYIFAETSVEPHYWYNYVPSRSVITSDGLHYIRNYHPGRRFITHIDKVERNMFYFDSWVQSSTQNDKTKFLLERYSYRQPEELFDLNKDKNEFVNLVNSDLSKNDVAKLKAMLQAELNRQGEDEASIIHGSLPDFYDRSYEIRQNTGASDLSFNRKIWNPDTLYVNGYLDGIEKGGIVCDYFGQFKISVFQNKIGVEFADGKVFYSPVLRQNRGHLLFRLTRGGQLQMYFDNSLVLREDVKADFTKIKAGYVTCGKLQGVEAVGKYQSFIGRITDLKFSMNTLSRSPQ